MVTRKSRGAQTQHLIAAWYSERGWPYAESTGAGRGGVDVTGMPGLAVEVKARRDFSPMAWLRQAAKDRSGLPFVVHRPDGMGPGTLADWPVTMRLVDHTILLRAAGFGGDDSSDARFRTYLSHFGLAVVVDEAGAIAPVDP